MPNMTQLKQPSRLCAAIVALCYLWLGVVVSFQHTHGWNEAGETRTVAFAASASSHQNHSAAPQITKQARINASHCIACEWQTLSASPALPIRQWHFTPSFAPRIVNTFPRYLPVPSFPSASRGPPAV